MTAVTEISQYPAPAAGATAAGGLLARVNGRVRNWLLGQEAFDLLAVGRQTSDIYLAGLGLRTGQSG